MKGGFRANLIIFRSKIDFQMRIKILARFHQFLIFELKGKGLEPSRVELKILQLDLEENFKDILQHFKFSN